VTQIAMLTATSWEK